MQSVLSALRVLEEVAARQPAGVAELARALDMPKSSVHRALTTLREAGWVRSTGGELPRYLLTSRALTVGRSASAETGLREAALPEMQRLRDATDETIHLSLRESDDVVLIERVDCRQAVRTFNALGTHAPLHASASGKAVLALLPSEEIDRIIDLGLRGYTSATVVDEGALRMELADIRERGYATNTGEWRPDVAAVGAAVCGDDGQPLGAINVSAPASRTTPDDLVRHGALLLRACAAVEQRLGIRPRS
ncbi:MAG: IclR family transcriptional regulator [Mycobacterium sp.]|jgi:IclR family acetate operon transcriptional repressor|nr:IclR family transcriptional regulator [Mycobacterium sp.]